MRIIFDNQQDGIAGFEVQPVVQKFDGAFRRVFDPGVHAARGGDKLVRTAQKDSIAHRKTATPDLLDAQANVQRRRINNLALEIAPVRVNLIAPGFVDTGLSAELLGDQLEKRRDQLRTTLPIGRVVGPADVAALAVHIIMTNTALTGATYDVDGGQQFVNA